MLRSRRTFLLAYLAVVLLSLVGPSPCVTQDHADDEIDKSPPKGMSVEEVIRRFTVKEKEWKKAREAYAFQQSIKAEALDGEKPVGEYRQVAEIRYEGGQPVRKVLLSPQASIQMSPEDLDDLNTRATFTISTDELPIYDVVYAGQQKVDELHCYIFDVVPKRQDPGKRYFQGRIWVDDQDFQIVKNSGKSVPDIKITKKKKLQENLFPKFTTWRQQIDNKFWFPTFSSADDTLHFNTGDVRIKQLVKLTNYRKAAGSL
jgi:hypothetical protein